MEAIEKSVFQWIDNNSAESCFPNEDWSPLQFISSLDHVSDAAGTLIATSANCNHQSSSRAVPSLTSLHIAVSKGRIDIVNQLIKANCNVNLEDQYGFTALHYAVIKRANEIILLLLNNGASVTCQSKTGSTAKDLAKILKFTEIEDILSSRMSTEADPSVPNFKDWLCHLGAGEYLSKFLSAGYDLPFIVRAGLVEADLDCVGIPMSKLGIRKKIIALHNLSDYYKEIVEDDKDKKKEEEEEEEEGSDEEDEEENESDDDESVEDED